MTWSQRAKIALGVANGLSHLHSRQIVHLNIKASNIMLDKNFEPKIGTPLCKDSLLGLHPDEVPAHLPKSAQKAENINLNLDVHSYGVFLYTLTTGIKSLNFWVWYESVESTKC